MNAHKNDYLTNAVMQANPEQLQLMLYDGAIRFAQQGRDAIERKDFEQIYESFTRAQRIVLEMQGGLRPDVNPEICEQLSALYNFVYRKLIDAGVKRDVESVDAALKILKHQRETWVMLMEKVADVRDSATFDAPQESGEPIASGTLCVEG